MGGIRTGRSYDDVMLVPKRSPVTELKQVDTSSRLAPGLTLELPVLSAPMDTVTEAAMAQALAEHGGMGVIHRFLTVAEQAAEVQQASEVDGPVAAAVGIEEDTAERARAVIEAGADCVVLDIAHGHLDACIAAVEELSSSIDVPVVAGNVATAEAVADLAEAGADCIKVGIGPGSHCTTRRVAGAGVPQLTAVQDCAAAAAEHGVTTIADGGVRAPGEAVKALMGGADAVMCGGLFMGTEEAPGAVVERDGQRYKRSRGMASDEARAERSDRDGEADAAYAEEGVAGLTPYKGSVEDELRQLHGGLRSGISYCGADALDAARANAEFIAVSDGAKSRAGAHGHGIVRR